MIGYRDNVNNVPEHSEAKYGYSMRMYAHLILRSLEPTTVGNVWKWPLVINLYIIGLFKIPGP